MVSNGLTPVLVTTSELRLAFRRFMEPSFPQLVVLAYQEIPSETFIEPFGAISLPEFSIPQEISAHMEEGAKVPSLGQFLNWLFNNPLANAGRRNNSST